MEAVAQVGGVYHVRCPRCGYEQKNCPAPPENVHQRCPKGPNPPPRSPLVLKAGAKPDPPPEGVGTEFMALAKELGFTACQLCKQTAAKMNREGPAWCREQRAWLIAEVKANFQKIADGTAIELERLKDPSKIDEPLAVECRRGWLATLLEKSKMMTGAAKHAAALFAKGEWAPNPLDPIGSMIDEAIRRAEAKGATVIR